MVLSIGMIVKNEEKYLERCLAALQPILNELDSELIIADTGSTDRTVEIAKKFTDNVFHFEWINDFAAARNFTLKKARGEWYMFIDADEIAQDCSNIIKFFKSGEYKKYHSASYVQSSFNNEMAIEDRIDFRVLRVVERFSDTKFVNPIHELLAPVYNPTKNLDFIVDHYGYVFNDENGINELAFTKSKRNLEYLFKELDELTDEQIQNSRYSIYDQIADSYEIIGDNEKSLEYINIGLEKLRHDKYDIAPYYSHKLAFLLNSERLGEIIEVGKEYFDKEKNPWHTKDFATDCYVRAVCGYAYYKFKNYDKAIEYYSKFIELYGKHLKGKLETEDLFVNIWRVSEPIAKASFDAFFRCCYQEKRFALANDYTKAIPLESYFDDQSFMINHLNIRVEMMENIGYKKLDELYRQLDEFGKNHLLTLVRPKVFKATPEKRAVIIKKLASLGGIPSDLAQIYRSYFDNNYANFELIKSFLGKYGSENGEDMLLILMVQNLDITPFVRSNDFFADRAVQLSFVNYEAPMKVFEDYNISAISDEGLELSASLYGWIMLRALDRNYKIARVFEKYGDIGLQWYNEFQSEKMPGDIRAALLVNNVAEAHGKRDLAAFRKSVDELKKVVPDLIPVVNAYYNEVEDDFADGVSPEFAQLAFQVKQNIRDLIRVGNIKDARSLLGELAGVCPNDPDIEVIKKEINNTLQ